MKIQNMNFGVGKICICVEKIFPLFHQIRNKMHHFKIHGSARKFLFHYYSDFSRFWFRYFWDSCHDFSVLLFILFSGISGTNHTNKNNINLHLNLFISFIPLFIISSVVGTFTLLKDSFYNHKERQSDDIYSSVEKLSISLACAHTSCKACRA